MDDEYVNSKTESESTSDQIELEALKAGEEKKLLNFYREFHERGEKIATYWQWRQKEKYTVRIGTDYVAKFNGRIVGAMGINPVIHTYKGDKIVACYHRDTLISPAMRGRGLVKKLLEVASNQWNMVLGKGSNEIMYKVRKSFGWQDVPNSDNMAFVLKPWPTGKSLRIRLFHLLLFVWGTALCSIYSKQSTSCYEVSKFDDKFDDLANNLSKNDKFKIYKNSSYLNWRYFNCPEKKYTVLRTIDNNIAGAIVLRLPKKKTEEAWIVDCICDSANVKCLRELFSEALKQAKRAGVSKILVFATLPDFRKILSKFGFVSIKRSPKFTYIINSDHILTNKINHIKWDFWHGDSDNELYE